MKTFIDFIYTLLIGAAVAVFVGFGIWTFYSSPKYPQPEYPNYGYAAPTPEQEKKYQEQEKKNQEEFKQYDKKNEDYSKKIAGIALAASIVFYLAGLYILRRDDVVGEGLALGGIFTGVYAAVRAGIGDFKQLVFASVTLILVMLILLALLRLRWHKPVATSKHKK